MTAAMLTFAGTLLVAMIGAVIARLDANTGTRSCRRRSTSWRSCRTTRRHMRG
ncbi:hypothetical protein [Gordonia sp. JH63]|uniref:hypothetical protein n=1 Tax=Gordonia sp. JH63 TaxID=2698900 RepID=UPI001EF08A4B|nr:hypothetical protein [Gordonia sp. JH63]